MTAPPITAPAIESSPPRMTTGKTRRPTAETLWLTPTMLPSMMPPMAAEAAARPQATANTRGMLMPMLSAAIWSSAIARIAMPSLV